MRSREIFPPGQWQLSHDNAAFVGSFFGACDFETLYRRSGGHPINPVEIADYIDAVNAQRMLNLGYNGFVSGDGGVPVPPVGCASQSGVGSPVGVKTPAFLNQLYHDTDGDVYWRSTGLTSTDWAEISGGSSGIVILAVTLDTFRISADSIDTSLSFPALTGVVDAELNVSNNSGLTSISAPLLTSTAGPLSASNCSSLASVNFDSLVTVSNDLTFSGCVSLTELSLPSLVTISNSLVCSACSTLTTVSVPVWVPVNGCLIDFSGCALSQASVDHVLARCVANAGFVSGAVDLSGGTNAPPGVQGLLDVTTLTGRGVTVTVN